VPDTTAGSSKLVIRMIPVMTARSARYAQRWHTALQEGPSLRCPDPEALPSSPSSPAVTAGQPRTVKVPRHMYTRKPGLTAPLSRIQRAPIRRMAKTERRQRL